MAVEDFTEISAEEQKKKLRKFFKSIGVSGTLVTGYLHQDEYLSELLGTLGQEKYFVMEYSNSTIRKLMHAVNNPIKSAEWTVEPFSNEKKDLEAASLMEQILFHDLEDGWKAKLDEILTFPWRGHSVFEVIHKNRSHKKFGFYTGLDNIAFRDQRTIEQWHYKNGRLEKIQQSQSGDIVPEGGSDVFIEADRLVIFYNEKKGNDAGFPFLRMLYGNYKRVNLYKTIQAIGLEKGALGTPKLTLPQGVSTDDEEAEKAEALLAAYTQGENAYFILPQGYELEIDQNGNFDPAKIQTAIKAENEEIAGSLVAMFLEMGIGGNSAVGSSTSESVEFFRDGIEYLADRISDTVNIKLMPNLCALNYGDTLDGLPKLVHHGISDEAGEELMKVVTGYVKDGVIKSDNGLEDHVRRVHNLPKKEEGEEMENPSNEETEIEEEEDSIEEEVELNTKKKKSPKKLMDEQGEKISQKIKDSLGFASQKYIIDVMNRYGQLPEKKKQNATNKIVLSKRSELRRELKKELAITAEKAIAMARTEVPARKDIVLSNKKEDMIRLSEKYGPEVLEIKLNEFSDLPAYVQVLVSKQAELISEHSLNELKTRMDFAFSGAERKSSDPAIIKQAMQEEADGFISSNQVKTKGDNVASLVVNEGRSTFFSEDDVLEEIHSFTFMNGAPVAAVCRELAGTTFSTTDASSLRYSPPLHHNAVLSDTLIETDSGKKKIQDIVIGEKVLTHTGLFQEVYDVMDRYEDKHYFEIELDNGKKINITAEHPILTRRGWKRVDELSLEDDIVCMEDI